LGEFLRRKIYIVFPLDHQFYRLVASYGFLYLYWFLGVLALFLLSLKIKEAVFAEKIEEEHCPI
jgi:hypothetical protein